MNKTKNTLIRGLYRKFFMAVKNSVV